MNTSANTDSSERNEVSTEVFHFNADSQSFEDLGRDNGFRYWMATDFAKCLEYEDYNSFLKAMNRGIAACAQLNIAIDENFVAQTRSIDGKQVKDYKLSRFACYLTAMNGDPKKARVAQAQAYFVVMAESFRQYLEDANDIERLVIRDEITGREKSLGGVAKQAGVVEYALFQNAGYRGLYNMNLRQLKEFKRVPKKDKSLLDYMGKTELAANLFRITQTEEKIKNESIRGQKPCEVAAETVGRTVRATMQKLSGTKPENLPLDTDIHVTRSNLQHAHKGFKNLDRKGKKK